MPNPARKRAAPQPTLELVEPAEPAPVREPEQLPLIRMLEVVRDRVESIHVGQHVMTNELREIKARLAHAAPSTLTADGGAPRQGDRRASQWRVSLLPGA